MHLNIIQQQWNACPCGTTADHPGSKCLARLAWSERHANPPGAARTTGATALADSHANGHGPSWP
jgi:hypothetical protein